MQTITTSAELLVSNGFDCIKCGHEFTKEDIQETIEQLGQEPFNGVLLECPDCDAVYSFDMITDSNDTKSEIRHVCSPCGIAANVTTCLERYGEPPKQLAFTVSTFHTGICDWCEEEKSVTEVRDFFYPDFKWLALARTRKLNEPKNG